MSFNDMNHFERMEDPEERKPEDLVRRKKGKANFRKKSFGRSVSLRTFKSSAFLVQLFVWIVFITVIGYGTYLGVGYFMNN